MLQLIERGLMFGNLFLVDSPIMVSRYNRALKQLAGRETGLTEFHVDISGYSPEIGDELGDDRYLNHNGCNRQFILLNTAQAQCPLLNAHFSTNREILASFIQDNEPQLASLTARDAVAGVLENSVFEIREPDNLLRHRRIHIQADTTQHHIATARLLAEKIERFDSEAGAWKDDVLIAKIVELSRVVGDITHHPVELTNVAFDTPNFWTSHLGGAYVFADRRAPVIVARDPKRFEGLTGAELIALSDRNRLAAFLHDSKLVQNILEVPREKALRILRQKTDFILIGAAAEAGHFHGGASRHEINALPGILRDDVPDAYFVLDRVMDWVQNGGKWPEIHSGNPAFFYLLRGAAGPDRDLVNMLLSELCPRDVQKMFIFHKEHFYRTYAGWSETKKRFVAEFLERSYKLNKAGVREDLFGPDPLTPRPAEGRVS